MGKGRVGGDGEGEGGVKKQGNSMTESEETRGEGWKQTERIA